MCVSVVVDENWRIKNDIYSVGVFLFLERNARE